MMKKTVPFPILLIVACLYCVSRAQAIVPEYTIKEGILHIAGVGPDNAIIYDNDWWCNSFDNKYLWAQVSMGKANLRGNIVSRDMRDGEKGYRYPMQSCLNDATKALELARESGLQNIPDLTPGADEVLEVPASGKIADTVAKPSPGSRLIIEEARKATPGKPLILVAGGPLTTVANALLLAPEIAPRLVVFHNLQHDGNGKDGWAVYIVAKKTRYVNWGGLAGGLWEKNSVFTASDFESLPQNAFCDDMRRLIGSDHGQVNQLGDGAPLVWLFNPPCWTGAAIHSANFKGHTVGFTLAKHGDTGDALVVAEANTDVKECATEFFRVLRDPALFPSTAAQSGLQVSGNHRFLVTGDGKPFFWLADTAWQLIHDLNREEVDLYLESRARKGFNVVQTVALAEHGGLNQPNAYGHFPLVDRDPARPDVREGDDYWKQVDYLIGQAAQRGLYVALLPTWGVHVTRDFTDGKVNGIFNVANAEIYGRFLGERYRQQSNIIWMIGGDRAASTEEARAVWRAMARGIAIGVAGSEDYSKVFMSFHPVGPGLSFDYFPKEDWLDFHGIQSSHGPAILNWKMIAGGYRREPAKPVIDLETTYAEITFSKQTVPLTDAMVRRAGYWAVFAGACGHTYGHNSIWQMFVPGKNAPRLGAKTSWQDALDAPGADQMGYLRKLIESRPFLTQKPDNTLLAFEQSDPTTMCLALRGEGFALIYTPTGRTLKVDLCKPGGGSVKALWFDPRTGASTEAGEFRNDSVHSFDPPGEDAAGNDWVLCLEAH